MKKRNIEGSIRAAMSDTPVILINGARQTGKSTLVKMIAAGMPGMEYLTLDDAVVAAAAASDPVGFIRQRRGPVVIDEIQKVPALLPEIKMRVDEHRRPGQFLLTGSANVMLLPRISESLAGRMEIIHLHPFSQGEIENRRDSFIESLFRRPEIDTAPQRESDDQLQKRLIHGGFPEAAGRKDDNRRDAWFGSYLTAILQRDVRELANIDGLTRIPNVLSLLASRSSGLLNVSDIARSMGLPVSTANRYLTLLETLFLVLRLPAWSPNLGKRLVKAPKIHVCDSGLACYLVGAGGERLKKDRLLWGLLLESFAVMEIKKQLSWAAQRAGIFHFRSAGGAEVDIVLERRDGTIVGIEIKGSASVVAGDFSGIRSLAEMAGKRFHCGVILYTGDKVLPFGKRLWAAPLPCLWS